MRAAWLVIASASIAVAAPRTQLVQVPAPAVSFAGIDLVQARRSPVITLAVTQLARAIGVPVPASDAFVIAGVPGLRETSTRIGAPIRGSLAWGAIWLDAETQRRIASVMPDLGEVVWVAGTLEASDAGVTLSATAAIDPYAAARVAVSIGMVRKLAATQLPTKVATAVDKVALTAMGASIRISATWTLTDVAALLSLAAE